MSLRRWARALGRFLDGSAAPPPTRPPADTAALLANDTAIVVVLDAGGTIRSASPSLARVLGYSPDGAIGKSAFDLVHPRDLAPALRFYSAHLESAGGTPPLRVRLRAADGSWRSVELVADNRLDDPVMNGIVVTAHNTVPPRPRPRPTGLRPLRPAPADQQGSEAPMHHGSELRAIVSPAGLVRYVSPSIEQLMGYLPADLVGQSVFEQIHPEDQPQLQRVLTLLAEQGQQGQPAPPIELRYQALDGSWRYLEVTGTNLLNDPDGGGIVVNTRDITERKRGEALLARETTILEMIATDMPLDPILDELARLSEAHCPDGMAAILLLDADGVTLRRGAAPNLPPQYAATLDGLVSGPSAGAAGAAAYEGEPVSTGDIASDPRWSQTRRLALRHGLRAAWAVPITGSRAGMIGAVIGTLAMYYPQPCENLTMDWPLIGRCLDLAAIAIERKELAAELTYQAFHDPLTGLPNRALFLERLDRALARANRQGERLAILFLDLDRFKTINDSLGHEAGDQVLAGVGERLRRCVRPQDTVARLGGDEFTLLLDPLGEIDDATHAAERITEALAAPFVLWSGEGRREVFVGASIGVMLSTGSDDRAEDLLKHADTAMYRAKGTGKAHYEVFNASMSAAVLAQFALEADLRRAIERGELRVHYQPKVQLRSGAVVGFEALVRWQHAEHGLIEPAKFIPLAEETGLIVPLGRWVLEEACRQARAWQLRYPAGAPLISVNLCARQFQHPGLLETVAQVVQESGIEPSRLVLELTESALLGDLDSHIAILAALKGLGIQLALDDFGMGYSSLSYLRRFPVDTLKIDRSFVDGLGRNRQNTAIVRALITLAQTLGLSVTAEGVETTGQLLQLRALGCELAQGYYFAKPLAAIEAEHLLERSVMPAGAGSGGLFLRQRAMLAAADAQERSAIDAQSQSRVGAAHARSPRA